MPQWDYVCSKCGDTQIVTGNINEYEDIGLKEKTCRKKGCDGIYEHTFEATNVGHTWRHGKPTPRFYR
jgi:hypothetical protein